MSEWTWLNDKTVGELVHRDFWKPGLVIEVREGKKKRQLLVGDINPLGGVCDDCTGVSDDTPVLRWKTVTW